LSGRGDVEAELSELLPQSSIDGASTLSAGERALDDALSEESDFGMDDITPEELSEGFDAGLLKKLRQDCTMEELEAIRRERNRIHARRTRERKRYLFERTKTVRSTHLRACL
jgi:hypothetical protein